MKLIRPPCREKVKQKSISVLNFSIRPFTVTQTVQLQSTTISCRTEINGKDEKLAVDLLRQDLERYMALQKEKGKAGQSSDSEMALCHGRRKTEVSKAHQILVDYRLALSLSSATASDQCVLAAIQEEEMLAERDWVLARSLEGDGTDPHSNGRGIESSDRERPSPNFEIESICEAIGSLAKLSVMDGDHPLPEKSRTPDLCVSCMEQVREDLLPQLTCGHH